MVRCNACGQTWPRDPALEVPCPTCHAPVGGPCRRPSGHACALHADRDRLAMAQGVLTPCPVAAKQLQAAHDQAGQATRDNARQLSLFACDHAEERDG